MNTADIEERIVQSLAGPRLVAVPHILERDQYIGSVLKQFLAKRIAPIERQVFIQEHITHLVGFPEGGQTVYFVTEDDPQSVFFDPRTNAFGCAWGPEAGSNQFFDLGFRSEDVLAMAAA